MDALVFADTPDNRSMPTSTVIPVLYYSDVEAAVAWLRKSFGFTERLRIGTHRVQMNIGGGAIVVAGGPGGPSPPAGQSVMIRVRDVDSHYEQAATHGVELLAKPESYPYGERQYTVRDLGGHVWTFSQSIKDVDPASWGGNLVNAST